MKYMNIDEANGSVFGYSVNNLLENDLIKVLKEIEDKYGKVSKNKLHVAIFAGNWKTWFAYIEQSDIIIMVQFLKKGDGLNVEVIKGYDLFDNVYKRERVGIDSGELYTKIRKLK